MRGENVNFHGKEENANWRNFREKTLFFSLKEKCFEAIFRQKEIHYILDSYLAW